MESEKLKLRKNFEKEKQELTSTRQHEKVRIPNNAFKACIVSVINDYQQVIVHFEKCSVFHLKSPVHFRHIQFFVFQSSSPFSWSAITLEDDDKS